MPRINDYIINKYRVSIASFIDSQYPHNIPSPKEVLIKLLNSYVNVLGIPHTSFFKAFTNTHNSFVENLLSAINQNGFQLRSELPTFLNDYLISNKLNKDGDFFALLVAFFSYYREIFGDLHTFQGLKMEVLIPLGFYTRKKANDQLDKLLKGLDENSMKADWICQTLGKVDISPSRWEEVIHKLFTLILNKYHVGLYDMSRSACKALLSIQVPSEMTDNLASIIINYLEVVERNYPISYNLLCKKLQSLNLSHRKRQEVFDYFHSKIKPGMEYHHLGSDWLVLNRLSDTNEILMSFINKQLVILQENEDPKKLEKACLSLSRLPSLRTLPEQSQEEIVQALLGKTTNSDTQVCRAAFSTLSAIPIPKNLETIVLDTMIKNISAEIDEPMQALSVMPIPEDRLIEIIDALVKTTVGVLGYRPQPFITLSKIRIPDEIKKDLASKLIALLDKAPEYVVSGVCYALGNVGILLNGAEIDKLLSIAETDNDGWRKNAVYEILPHIVPHEMKDKIFDMLLKHLELENLALEAAHGSLVTLADTKAKRARLINALLEKLTKVSPIGIEQICETLVQLQHKTSLEETIALKAKIEFLAIHLSELSNLKLIPFFKKLDDICTTKGLLTRNLPPDISAQIIEQKPFSLSR